MEQKLTEKLNFSFITDHNGRKFGVIPRGNEAKFDWNKSDVYEIINENTNQYVKIIGPTKSQIMEKFDEARTKLK